jgi:magnesium-transporting ATPase (P-type)
MINKTEAARRKYSAADQRPPSSPHFNDPALLERLHGGHVTATTIRDFMLVLSLCNTVQPECRTNEAWNAAHHHGDEDTPNPSSHHSRSNSLTTAQAQAVAEAVSASKASLAQVAIAMEGKTIATAVAGVKARAARSNSPPYSARPPAVPDPYNTSSNGGAAGVAENGDGGMMLENGDEVHSPSGGERKDGLVPTTDGSESPLASSTGVDDSTPPSPLVAGISASITITSVDGDTKSLSSMRGEAKRTGVIDTSDASGMTNDYGSTGAHDTNGNGNRTNGNVDDKITYQADSPDEFAMVTTARGLGYQLRSRIGRHLVLRVDGVDESYEVLNSLAFTSKRKRMSVILRCPDGRIQLLCKGADEVIGPRLANVTENTEAWESTQDHLTEFAQDGLRTMVSAGVVLDDTRYENWSKRYHAATVNLNVEQGKADIDALCEEIESGMTLLGATAVEDKLQEGVAETIESLRRGGIKVWTLTGDKQETAMSIGAMSRVLTEDMEVLVLQENMTEDELSAALDRIIIEHSLRLSPHFIEKKTGRKRQVKSSVSGGGAPGASTVPSALAPLTLPSSAVSLSSHATSSTSVREDVAIRISPERPLGERTSSDNRSPAPSPRHATNGGALRVTTLEESKMPLGSSSPATSHASPFQSPMNTPGSTSSVSSNRRFGGTNVGKRHRLTIDSPSPSPRLGPAMTVVSPPSPMSLSRLAAAAPAGVAGDITASPSLPSLSGLASLRGVRSPSLGDRHASDVPQRPLALVCSGSTLATALPQSVTGDEDDLDDLSIKFFAVAKACVSVICYRCTPMQKSTAVRTVSERSVLWGDGAITLAIGDGANDVPMLLQAHVGVGMSGNEGMQAVLASDFSIPRFHMLQRLLLVHGYRSNKRMSILILYSVFKNLGLCLPQFWFSFWSGFSGQLLYFDFLFTMFNSLFTALPILAVTMFDTDASDDTLTKNHRGNALYMTAGGRSGKVGEFIRWLLMGFWMSFVVFIVPFASLSDMPASDGTTLGMWGEGLACYTYLIVACQLQIALHTKQWTKSNVVAMTVSSVSYIVFVLVLTTFTLTEFGLVWMQQSAYGVLRELLSLPAFWLGLILAPLLSILPGFVFEAATQLFNPPLAYQLSLAERERKRALHAAGVTADTTSSTSSISSDKNGITTRARGPLAYARLE